jgi:hypothetical protein
MVNTDRMRSIAKRQMWTAINRGNDQTMVCQVCPLKKIKVKEEADWRDKDCDAA